ncbi:MAG: Flagellin and related hook-associated protein FlgL [Thermodesulfobacterium sp.]|uniref:Flagellin n=1 Tax=Candidatus Thermodesulfobacterium syntrophicum TaxID=3060442 RepID=A0AAE3P4S6_9BACT|nr:Flagellin and related hook-associated protein FlgL [Candidatus Thermodesulfobacterium syntrophicum]
MAVRINFNEAAAKTHTALIQNERAMTKSLLRLSTGYRILSAADDSAGLFIADMLGTVAAALDQGNANIQTGISALQIAETNAGQIYTKLQEIYIRAQRAANDINDPNARNALQSEINNFIDAIQKIATDTEYNGIKLLDGTFSSKYIHYGARRNQRVTISISSLKATDLGAYTATGTGQSTAVTSATTDAFSTWIQNQSDYWVAAGEYLQVNGIAVQGDSGKIVDASVIANNINNNDTLVAQGIEATATNTSTADTAFDKIGDITIKGSATDSSATVNLVLNFYVGNDTTVDFSLTSTSVTVSGTNTSTGSLFNDIDDLISQINTAASNNDVEITATESDDGKLILTTTNGETIGIEAKLNVTVSNTASITAVINLDQLIEGASSVTYTNASLTANTTQYVHAVKVGDLTIGGIDNFTVSNNGLGALSGITSVSRQSLYSIDVTSNTGAELAIMIATKALQKVDTIRADIGATMNNLQAIYDAQKSAYDNTKEAESVIRNTDYAKEMSEFTSYQIRMQATIAMLAQANTLPQLVLQLMR